MRRAIFFFFGFFFTSLLTHVVREFTRISLLIAIISINRTHDGGETLFSPWFAVEKEGRRDIFIRYTIIIISFRIIEFIAIA